MLEGAARRNGVELSEHLLNTDAESEGTSAATEKYLLPNQIQSVHLGMQERLIIFQVLHPRLLPPKCPPSHHCPLCHLARHHPHLLWTHIQVGNCIFFLPIFNLSFLSVLTRSTSLRIPMSGSRCKWISNFSLGATPPPALLPSP